MVLRMNEDKDWSLKRKDRNVSTDAINYHKSPGEFDEWYDEDVYKKSDIETLRTKLIADIQNIDYDRIEKDNEYDLIYDLSQKINKRFGVE